MWLAFFLLIAAPVLADTPNDAVTLASIDLATLPATLQPHQQYLWNHDGNPHAWQAVTFTLNCISRREDNIVATPVRFQGRPDLDNKLIRFDVLQLAPALADYLQMRALLDSFVVREPHFYALGQGTIEVEPITISGAPFNSLTIRTFGPHIWNHEASASLTTLTGGRLAPILRLDHFVSLALTTIKGGRYYDLLGIHGKTQAAYLLSRGASEDKVAETRSDERAGIVQSKNTGKPRRVDMFQHSGTRPSVGPGLVAITRDCFDEDVENPDFDPLRNLLFLQTRGQEIILVRPNGWHEWTLFNAEGTLVNEAPPGLASDTGIPNPHTKRLFPGMGCIRCHGKERGWQPFPNDVQRIQLASGSFFLGDLKADADQADVLRRLDGLYKGDLREPLRLGRNAYAGIVWKATRMEVEDLSAVVAAVHDGYRYRLVDALQACREIGIQPLLGMPELAAITLHVALTPPPADANGNAIEDPNVLALKSGIGLNRDQFNHIYTDLCVRSAAYINKPEPAQ